MQKRNYDLTLIKTIMVKLIENMPLEENNRPHLLSGNYSGFWECHIKPDWLLIYQFSEEINENDELIEYITFVRTGTHSDLF